MSTKPKLNPPSVTRTVVSDLSTLLQDPDVTEITTPTPAVQPKPVKEAAGEPAAESSRLSISVSKDFAKALHALADDLQGAKPGRGNISLLLRTSVIAAYPDRFRPVRAEQ